jgi:hypothetical protein
MPNLAACPFFWKVGSTIVVKDRLSKALKLGWYAEMHKGIRRKQGSGLVLTGY